MNKYKKLKIYNFGKSISAFKKMKKIKCLIFGNFGAMNLGDESILSGEIYEILKYRPDSEICVVSRYPKTIKKIHGERVNSVYVKSIFNVIKEVLKANIIIVGGGGLFCRSGDGLNGLLYQQYFMWIFILLPKLLLKKVYALGIGIYSNMNKFNLFTAIKMLKMADKVTVRDFHSFDLLKKYRVKTNIYKDNSYLMPLDIRNIKLKSINNYNSKLNNVGISLRRPYDSKASEMLLKQLVIFMKTKHDYNFWLFSLDDHPNKKNDTIFNRKLINLAKKYSIKVHIVDDAAHPVEAFSIFKLMDYMICMRLHSMIFSDRLSIPFSGISYDTKCESFLGSVGKKSLVIDTNLNNVLARNIKL